MDTRIKLLLVNLKRLLSLSKSTALPSKFHFGRILICWGIVLLLPFQSHARHKCPQPPVNASPLGLFLTTTYLPIATTMAGTRSSGTSGCQKGHASEKFYTPSVQRMGDFLERALVQVEEESVQGQGEHLTALVQLSGCELDSKSIFAQQLQIHYSQIFQSTDIELSAHQKAFATSHRIWTLTQTHESLKPFCTNLYESQKIF